MFVSGPLWKWIFYQRNKIIIIKNLVIVKIFWKIWNFYKKLGILVCYIQTFWISLWKNSLNLLLKFCYNQLKMLYEYKSQNRTVWKVCFSRVLIKSWCRYSRVWLYTKYIPVPSLYSSYFNDSELIVDALGNTWLWINSQCSWKHINSIFFC